MAIKIGFIDNAGQFCRLGQNLDFYSHNLAAIPILIVMI
jgi:hypothetical protein